MIDDKEEKLLPIDEETGEIAYDKIDKSFNDVLKETYAELGAMTWPCVLMAAIFAGIFAFLGGVGLLFLFYFFKMLFIVSPFLFAAFAIGFAGTFILAFVSKKRSNGGQK